MWNHGIPYILKQFIDVVSQPGMVFAFDAEQGYTGLLTGKRAVVVYTSAVYGTGRPAAFGSDFQAPYFNDWLAWAGITDTTEIPSGPTSPPPTPTPAGRRHTPPPARPPRSSDQSTAPGPRPAGPTADARPRSGTWWPAAIDVTYDGTVGEEVLRSPGRAAARCCWRSGRMSGGTIGAAGPGTSRIRFRKKSPLDVGDLDFVIEVRTKLFGTVCRTTCADEIRDRLSALPLGR